jgi:hypothetical protein
MSILIVEDKKPHKTVASSDTVAGQLMDYILAMCAFGHPNPFAVLTTFQDSWVAWLDIGASKDIARSEDRFNEDNPWKLLGQVSAPLVGTSPPITSTPATPSPPTARARGPDA